MITHSGALLCCNVLCSLWCHGTLGPFYSIPSPPLPLSSSPSLLPPSFLFCASSPLSSQARSFGLVSLGSRLSLRTTLSPFWIIDFTLLVDFPSLLSLRPPSHVLRPPIQTKRETNTFFPVLGSRRHSSRPLQITRVIIPYVRPPETYRLNQGQGIVPILPHTRRVGWSGCCSVTGNAIPGYRVPPFSAMPATSTNSFTSEKPLLHVE